MTHPLRLLIAFCLVFSCIPAFADGIIFPMDPEIPERFLIQPQPQSNFTVPLSVTYHRVKVDIKENAAETHIDQAFYNHEPRVIEGLYIFPLPTGASISGFAMDIEGKMTKGELLDSEKARSIYEDIVRRMQDPALLEYMGTGLFKTRIYPIEPHKEKQIKLDYQEALRMEGGMIRYVYPLNTEKFSRDPLKEVVIEARIQSKSPITTIYSPSHKVAIKKDGEFAATVSFEANNVKPDKDFILYYAVAKKDLSLSLLTHRPDPTEEGTFLMMLSPRTEAQQASVSAKNVAFVFDTSGSMAGAKMEQAKKALSFCVNALRDGDHFYLGSFATEVNPYKPGLLEVSKDSRAGAQEFVKNLEAVGGTNISEALHDAFQALRKGGGGRPSFLFFMTDGQPTAGSTDPEDIIKNSLSQNSEKARLFVFGVGDNVNTTLLDRLAEENGGVSDYVSETEDIEIKVSELYTKLAHPVLVDVSLDFANILTSQIYPQRIPDVFKGSHIMIVGRYKKPGEALITLSGSLNGKPAKFEFEGSFPERETENGFVARIWATRKIGFLLDQIRKNGMNEELKSEIVLLAKRYGILTPYTSYLVVEDKAISGPNLRDAMMPSNSSNLGGAPAFEENRKKFSMERFESEQAGADAVDAAREVQAMKSMSAPMAAPMDSFDGGVSGQMRSSPGRQHAAIKPPETRMIAERTFYMIEEKWVDSKADSDPTLKVKLFSPAYFLLAKKFPEISKFMALGRHLVVFVAGRTIEIHPNEGVSDTEALKL
jgi:Ca-activated chloride channel family protein